ncbi:hypothetical protein ABPG75_010255 [Micractinium tetrahymenae]
MPASERHTNIHHLPDDLLAHCLALLPQKDRFSHAPLVCKRFCGLVGRPHQLVLAIGRQCQPAALAQALPLMRALRSWLVKHGGSLRELDVGWHPDANGGEQDGAAEAASLLAGCLQAATSGSACRLRRLQLAVTPKPAGNMIYGLSGWAAATQSLQHLKVSVTGMLRLLCNLAGASQLRSLELQAQGFWFGPADALPPSLTKLGFACVGSVAGNLHELQVGNLAALRSLSLDSWTDWDVGPPVSGLSRLHGLQHLALTDCCVDEWLPAVAPHLTSLQALEMCTAKA